MTLAYLSLGSNVGERGAHLALGVEVASAGEPYRLSRVYQSEPVGGVIQDDFWNLVMELTTEASGEELLERARDAERRARRVRTIRWGPRTLDVDLLFVGDERRDDPELTLPHPRIYERSFVLVPLRELAPQLVSEGQLAAGAGHVVALGTLEALR
ncbi:MAG TPA: 2-amino-4-hydroxy-6-hydroxymethyldihydropteridine diphosphokinase [Acidimicrobiales bacterium]|nr:2-amino-4-hydroxy-6-hydroxymethyldihydropteridine diphosphokinase [Acidimicrobiales bacterium]